MSGGQPTEDDVIARMIEDMNNPNSFEVIPGAWVRPAPPLTEPPPYTPRPLIPVAEPIKNLILAYVDVNEIAEALVNGSQFLNLPGKTGTSVLGMELFKFLDNYYKTADPLPSPTSNAHISGGVIPGNGGSNVYGPLASLITPTDLTLSGNSLFIGDAADNRIRVVDIETGKVNNITIPIGGISTTSIDSNFQYPSAEIANYKASGGQIDKIAGLIEYRANPDDVNSEIIGYTGYGLSSITPYKTERGLENVPANRTGMVGFKALAASSDGTVYFSDFVERDPRITSATPSGNNTVYNVANTNGFEIGRAVRIRGYYGNGTTNNIAAGYNGSGLIQSFVLNTSVTVNIQSAGNPLTNGAVLYLESRLRRIPKLAY